MGELYFQTELKQSRLLADTESVFEENFSLYVILYYYISTISRGFFQVIII